MKRGILVVGSLNMDFVVTVPRLPAPGETILGQDFHMVPGGKGANQACAAGKLASEGVRVMMLGRVGYDLFGDHLKASLAAAGVDVSGVHATQAASTGVALIWVESSGQNSIVVAPGANHYLRKADLNGFRHLFQAASHVLLQLEVPLETVAAALELAHQEGAMTILDPAPAQPLPNQMLAHTDLLTPNETEACLLLGLAPRRLEPDEARRLAEQLRQRGAHQVVVKLGDAGCVYVGPDEAYAVPAFPVEARDATAAGDTFNGALAVALAEGQPIRAALRFANAAAALSVTRLGAQASIPTRAEVDEFLQRSGST